MRKLLAWWVALKQAQQRRAEREVLSRLDARTLKDVGLESWNGGLV